MLAGKQSGFKKEVRGLISVSDSGSGAQGKSRINTFQFSVYAVLWHIYIYLRFLCRSPTMLTIAKWFLELKPFMAITARNDEPKLGLIFKGIFNFPQQNFKEHSGSKLSAANVFVCTLAPYLQICCQHYLHGTVDSESWFRVTED